MQTQTRIRSPILLSRLIREPNTLPAPKGRSPHLPHSRLIHWGWFKATALFDPFTLHAVLAHSRSAAFSICRSKIGAWGEFASPGRPKPKEWGPHHDAVEGLVVLWMKPGELFTIVNRMGGPEHIILHKGSSLGSLFSRELLFKGINQGRMWVNRYFWGRA